jgi:hypothetical protein
MLRLRLKSTKITLTTGYMIERLVSGMRDINNLEIIMNTYIMIALPFLTMIIFGAVGLTADLLITKYLNTEIK